MHFFKAFNSAVGRQRHHGELALGLPSIPRSYDMGGVICKHQHCCQSLHLPSVLQLCCDLAHEEPALEPFHKYQFFLLMF